MEAGASLLLPSYFHRRVLGSLFPRLPVICKATHSYNIRRVDGKLVQMRKEVGKKVRKHDPYCAIWHKISALSIQE
jgi:hypothetical protein